MIAAVVYPAVAAIPAEQAPAEPVMLDSPGHVLLDAPAACRARNRKDEPCHSRPGSDGYCPAHRAKDS